MTLTTADFRDVGALIAKALQPKIRIAADPQYRQLLDRYRSVPQIREATDGVLNGLDLVVLAASDLGLVIAPYRESVFSARLSDLHNTKLVEGRVLAGVALAGIAAYAYPRREDLELERPRYVSVAGVDDFLRKQCEALAQSLGESDTQDVRAAWNEYSRLAPTRSGERSSRKSSRYWVRQVLGFLSDYGMARQDASTSGDQWLLTDRFRLHVADMAGSAAYDALAEIAARSGTAETALYRTSQEATVNLDSFDVSPEDDVDGPPGDDRDTDEAWAETGRARQDDLEAKTPPTSMQGPDDFDGQGALL
jgi:hypothetical protein